MDSGYVVLKVGLIYGDRTASKWPVRLVATPCHELCKCIHPVPQLNLKALSRCMHVYPAIFLLMQEETFNGPSELPAGTHLNYLVKGVQQILDIFVQKGFALKVSPIQQKGMWTHLCKTSLCLV